MSRAELRRQERSQKKDRKKAETLLKQAGIPPAPMRTSNLSVQEVANLTGAKVAVLEQWRREQTEEIKKRVL